MKGFFTNSGAQMDASLQTGAALTITRIVAGSGETDRTAAALEQECQTLAANPAVQEGTQVRLSAVLTDVEAEQDYTLTEVGVYARTDGEEILYQVFPMNTPLQVAAGAGELTIWLELDMILSEAAEITVQGTAAGLVTEEYLNTRLDKASVHLLWENASPTSGWNTTPIPISSVGDYDLFFVEMANHYESPITIWGMVRKGEAARMITNSYNASRGHMTIRRVITSTDDGFTVEKALNNSDEGHGDLVPLRIYGLKGVKTV